MSTLKTLQMDPTIDPWERQPGETSARYAQFCAYRDLGRTRTLRKAATTLTRADAWVRQVAAANWWRDRAEAYDRHLDKLYEQAWVEERRKAAEADAKILGAAVGKLAQRLPSLRADQLSPGDTIRLMDVVMRHRRVLFGDPQATIAVTGPGGDPLSVRLADFEELAPQERRRRLSELAAAVARRVSAADGDDDEAVYPAWEKEEATTGDSPAADAPDTGAEPARPAGEGVGPA
ncbi:hypothetical protein ACIBEJ_00655 [Nonomuraea sp. NPDC050790]|uniref:hypothetical protein n=1 Tax=Nonomuraea sp. NPDC050790 TaxID=3364371 RepID=UPI0037AA48F0